MGLADCGGGGGGYGFALAGRAAHEIQNSVANTDPQAVLDGGVVTFYKGTPYIKLPIGTAAFSFGVVFIGDEVGTRSDAIETVLHEYGHSVHFSQIGAANYFIYVAIPSLVGYWTDVEYADYYSQPYEYIADLFGKVERHHEGSPYPYSSVTDDWWVYWLITFWG